VVGCFEGITLAEIALAMAIMVWLVAEGFMADVDGVVGLDRNVMVSGFLEKKGYFVKGCLWVFVFLSLTLETFCCLWYARLLRQCMVCLLVSTFFFSSFFLMCVDVCVQCIHMQVVKPAHVGFGIFWFVGMYCVVVQLCFDTRHYL
jgi:hypothetical protein